MQKAECNCKNISFPVYALPGDSFMPGFSFLYYNGSLFTSETVMKWLLRERLKEGLHHYTYRTDYIAEIEPAKKAGAGCCRLANRLYLKVLSTEKL